MWKEIRQRTDIISPRVVHLYRLYIITYYYIINLYLCLKCLQQFTSVVTTCHSVDWLRHNQRDRTGLWNLPLTPGSLVQSGGSQTEASARGPGRFVTMGMAGPHPQSVRFSRSGVGPRFCISNSFPGAAAAAGLWAHLETHWCIRWPLISWCFWGTECST